MAGYGGYFLQGLASGLQTGFNLGQLKWQQNEKKKLQKKQEELLEQASVFNSQVAKAAENGISDDDMWKINTSYMALGYEVKQLVKDTYDAIQAMDKQRVENNYKMLDFISQAVQGLPAEDAQAIFDTFRPIVKSEKALQMYDAYETITQKRLEAMEKAPTPEIFRSVEELRAKYPNADWTYSASAGGYVPKPKTAEVTTKPSDYTTAVNYLSKFKYAKPKVFEAVKSGMQKQFPNLDLSAITQESLREPQKVEEPETRATSLTTLEKYREKILNADSFEEAQKYYDDYTQAGYDPTLLKVTPQNWINDKQVYLNNLLSEIQKLVDEKGWLRNNKIDPSELNIVEIEEAKPAPEIYEELRDEYMKYRDALEKADVDVSQFPKLKSIDEIERVGFIEGLKTIGVGRGQYQSIYY